MKDLIESDVNLIKAKFGNSIVKIGLFGSSLYKEQKDAKDIDLVIYTKVSLEAAKSLLMELKLNFPVCPHKMNGTYGEKENEIDEKHYHIIILKSENPNKEFERINKNTILFFN